MHHCPCELKFVEALLIVGTSQVCACPIIFFHTHPSIGLSSVDVYWLSRSAYPLDLLKSAIRSGTMWVTGLE